MRLKNVVRFSMKTRLWIAGFLWLLVGGIAFFYTVTGQQLVHWSQNTMTLMTQKADRALRWPIQIVWQDEMHYTKDEEIQKVKGLKSGQEMHSISLSSVQEKIEKLPWVRSAVVEVYWPNTLLITIAEKMPLAIWQYNRTYHPLDERAEIIDTTKLLPADLLLVVGADAPKHLLSLIQDLEQVPDIYQYVRAAVRINGRRWNLKLFNAEKGLEISLPESGVLAALRRLEAHNQKEKLIKRQIASIDLRTPDKVVIKPIAAQKEKKKVVRQ